MVAASEATKSTLWVGSVAQGSSLSQPRASAARPSAASTGVLIGD
jgi:hypothetical protein